MTAGTMTRSIIIATSSAETSEARVKSGYTATAIAEYFRDQGKDVLLIFDSIDRFVESLSDIKLAQDEHPHISGYPYSVSRDLSLLIERHSSTQNGTITSLYTCLTNDNDTGGLIVDDIRAMTNGTLLLSRKLTAMQHLPAIDVLSSSSQIAPQLTDVVTRRAILNTQILIKNYAMINDRVHLDFYARGTIPAIDEAIAKQKMIDEFLIQDVNENSPLDETLRRLKGIAGIK
jgi:flagellum-specific ATP synthase